MEKISGFTITALSMSGFKCFGDTVTFHFGNVTVFSASNGQGKSSIADAIAYAFVGTPFFGDRGLDRLQNFNTREMAVSVDFVDDIGEAHNLTRTRKYDTTAIFYDGRNIRQTDLYTIFGDKDIFLSILNPLYFINVLGDKGKHMLEKLLPVVKHAEVLAALPEYSRELLASQHLSYPEIFIKNRRAELKELEETLIGYRSQQELLGYQREERADNLKELRASIDRHTAEMAELVQARDFNRDLQADELKLAELRKRRNEMLMDDAPDEIDKIIRGITGEIKEVEKGIAQQTAMPYISPYSAQILGGEARLKVMYDEHARINKALNSTVVGYKCPVCVSVITSENVDAVKTELRSRIAVLVNEGKSAKNDLVEIKAQDDVAKREFDERVAATVRTERSRLSELNQQLQELNVARKLDTEDYCEQIMVLERQINAQEYRVANGNWTAEQAQRFHELETAKKECEAKLEALSSIADYDYAALIENTEAEVTQLKRLVSEGIGYMAKRIEMMLDGLKMRNTEIVLTEIIKSTGEIQDCFRFSYDGRDYRCLSLSEKIRAGLEVSALIQRLAGRNYPVFVDNSESISSLDDFQIPGQAVYARVVENQALHVAHSNRELLEIAA